MLLRDSAPNSPARGNGAELERFEIENDHLRHQISLLQLELENRRRAFLAVHEINASNEARARVRSPSQNVSTNSSYSSK